MQNDEMIWQVINHQFCSYKATIGKAKSDKTQFCKHPYSVTGLCNRTSCPLANSRYATLREENGRVYLFVKTVERAHSPKNLWEKILLSRNYSKALAQVDEHLQYFPKVLIHRNKQRLTKIHQYLLRIRKIELRARSGRKARVVGINRKIEQREERRERKALVAARIETNVQKELLERLARGTYGDMYDFNTSREREGKKKTLLGREAEEEQELEGGAEEETEMESDDLDEMEDVVEYVEDLLDSEEEEEEEEEEEDGGDDMEDLDYLGDGRWGNRRGDGMESEEDPDEDDEDSDSGEGDSSVDDGDDRSGNSSDSSDDEKVEPDRKKKKKKGDKKSPPGGNRRTGRGRGPRIEIEYEEEREDAHPAHQEASTTAGAAW